MNKVEYFTFSFHTKERDDKRTQRHVSSLQAAHPPRGPRPR